MRDFALGLAALGFGRGDKLSVIGDNRPRLYLAQLAAQSLGGIAVPVYQDAIASELAYVLDHAETSVIVAEDQEQVDKILSLQDRLPQLQLLDLRRSARAAQLRRSDCSTRSRTSRRPGASFGAAHPGYVEAEVDAGRPDDLALFSYTSGTTVAARRA